MSVLPSLRWHNFLDVDRLLTGTLKQTFFKNDNFQYFSELYKKIVHPPQKIAKLLIAKDCCFD